VVCFERILEGAALEFSEQGFGGASMASIGRAAGVTKGGVYFHFDSKEELFFAVLDEWNEGLRPIGVQVATGPLGGVKLGQPLHSKPGLQPGQYCPLVRLKMLQQQPSPPGQRDTSPGSSPRSARAGAKISLGPTVSTSIERTG